jgi:hypothetical protein
VAGTDGLLRKGGFPGEVVKRVEAREAATRYEVLAKSVTDPDLVKGYSDLAAEARERARGKA